MAHIEIKGDGAFTEVFVNGKKVDGIRKISFLQEPGQVPIVKLDLVADKMTIDSHVKIALPEVYQGWYEEKLPVPSGQIDENGNFEKIN